MLTKKYQPLRLKDIIGNTKSRDAVKAWAEKWEGGEKQKPLLICGPAGTGKTSTAYAIAKEMNWSIVEINAGNKRNKENMESVVGEGSTMSLFGGHRLILIDDVDQMSGREDKGAMTAITNIIKESKNPVILTALDFWDQKISALRTKVEKIEYKKVNSRSLATYLRTVAEKEDIPLNEQRIEQIIENVNGDVRAGLNDLESLTSEQRDTQINVFEVVRTIFKKTDYKKIRESVFNSSVDYDLLLLWIMENIPNEYEKKSDVADAFYYLSRADIFRGRIVRQQYWGYLRYVSDLMSCGVASAKKEPYYKFVKYSFPHYLSLMAKTKSSRSTIKSICKKIGAQTHDSIRDTQKELWLYSLMIKNKYNLNELYGLEKEEIEILKKI